MNPSPTEGASSNSPPPPEPDVPGPGSPEPASPEPGSPEPGSREPGTREAEAVSPLEAAISTPEQLPRRDRRRSASSRPNASPGQDPAGRPRTEADAVLNRLLTH